MLDRVGVPAAAVLVLEQHERAGRVDAGVAARVVGEQQRVQAERLGLVGHQLGEHRREADAPPRTATGGCARRRRWPRSPR